jgi:electron transfer flavoprotein alpha subunit
MGTLVIAEHDGQQVRAGSRSAIGFARRIEQHSGSPVELLILGAEIAAPAADAANLAPVIVADNPALRHPTADRYARVIADVAKARKAETIVAASTTFAKDILPRAAALLDASMASDVTGVAFDGGCPRYSRPVYAGAAIATVALECSPAIVTIRPTAFAPAEPAGAPFDIVSWNVDPAQLPAQIEYLGLESRATSRPELTEARVVVSGGRAFRTSDEFELYVGRLADALRGAAGCTRALVDAGIAPNEWQVGQTGKIVAPQLYVALGISGAVQHLAGMKNSRVVVAVNSDAEAPIFGVASYGLVGDVREVVPQMIAELERRG